MYFIWEIAEEYGLPMKYFWILYLGAWLRVAGSHSVNPLIYGIERSGDHRKNKELLYQVEK